MRPEGRKPDELRFSSIEPDFLLYAEGSVLVTTGNTKVICSASVQDFVPPFKKGTGEGWVSAEYSLLPRSTHIRSSRERGKVGGRTQEIQRTIGRVLRSVVDLSRLEEKTVWIDCDVMQADGGTRTASITGAYVALVLATRKLVEDGHIECDPIIGQVAATSVGIVDGSPVLDLEYSEDFQADVDMNVAMTSEDAFVELQGTAEGKTFKRGELDQLLDLAHKGIKELHQLQNEVLKK